MPNARPLEKKPIPLMELADKRQYPSAEMRYRQVDSLVEMCSVVNAKIQIVCLEAGKKQLAASRPCTICPTQISRVEVTAALRYMSQTHM